MKKIKFVESMTKSFHKDPQKLSEFPEFCKRALCMYEALRRIGFTPDFVFFQFAVDVKSNKPAFFVTINENGKADGKILFASVVCYTEKSEEKEMHKLFLKATNLWNECNQSEMMTIYKHGNHGYFNQADLVFTLVNKGLLNERQAKAEN